MLASLLLATAAAGPFIVLPTTGRLLDPQDKPADGAHILTFTIYPDAQKPMGATSDTVLWTDQFSVTVVGGVYSVVLGDVDQSANQTKLSLGVFLPNGPRFLGIKVDSDVELSPRLQFGYAPMAGDSLTLGGHPAADFLLGGQSGALTGDLAVSGAVSSTSAHVTGATQIDGALTAGSDHVTGASQIDGALAAGAATITGTLAAGATTLGTLAAGNTTITGTLGAGATTVGALAAGNTTITGTLGATGAATLGSLTVTGATKFTGAISGPTGGVLALASDASMDGHALYLRASTTDKFDYVAWDGAADRALLGGYNGSALGYTGGSSPTYVTVLSVDSSKNTTAANNLTVGGNITGANLKVTGTSLVGYHNISCTTTSGNTDCSCPAGEVILSGGGWTNGAGNVILRESRQLAEQDNRTWRITCITTGGTASTCAGMVITCARLGL